MSRRPLHPNDRTERNVRARYERERVQPRPTHIRGTEAHTTERLQQLDRDVASILRIVPHHLNQRIDIFGVRRRNPALQGRTSRYHDELGNLHILLKSLNDVRTELANDLQEYLQSSQEQRETVNWLSNFDEQVAREDIGALDAARSQLSRLLHRVGGKLRLPNFRVRHRRRAV
jgi:hypothetical protein